MVLSMKKIEQRRFSITAYLITTKERQKYYGDESKDSCTKKQDYIDDPRKFVKDFVKRLIKCKKNDLNDYMSVSEEHDIKLPSIVGNELTVNYGKSGQDFSTVKINGEINEYDKETKIVKYYKNFFLIREDGRVFMVIFRDGVNSCKTAIYNEMKSFLQGTNVIVDLTYVSNENYIRSLFDNIEFVNLNYNVVYREISPDNADDSKIIQKKYSSNTIDLSLQHKKNFKDFLNKILNHINGHQNRMELTTLLNDGLAENYCVDEDSLSVLVELNGVKRTIRIEDVARFYDVDITAKLEYDENGNPQNESILSEVIEYVSGIEIVE